MYFWELGTDMLGNSTRLDDSLSSFQREGMKLVHMKTVDIDINSNVLCFYGMCKHTEISGNIICLACFVYAQYRSKYKKEKN